MLTRKVSVRFLLLLCALIAGNLFLFYYTGGNISGDVERSYRETIQYQSNLIARLNRNITRLQHRLESLSLAPPDTHTDRSRSDSRRNLTTIYMITPTYARWTQKADLTRLCQTLMHVPNLHWIVVEDSEEKTDLVTNFLNRKRHVLTSTHLNVRTTEKLRLKDHEPVWRKNRGVEQRNLGLAWLRESAEAGALPEGGRGVVYFGDDDNTYDLQLFEEMRDTRMVSVWLVGISGGLRFEGPTCHRGRVTGWYTGWGFERAFQIDMAGFAVNLQLLLSHPGAKIDPDAQRGYLETSLLEKLVTLDQLEPKGDDCTKVFVWHTRTEVPKMKHEDRLIQRGRSSDPNIET